jgi:phosphate transport system protein
MTSYEARQQADLEHIGEMIEDVAARIQENLHNAIYALLTNDVDLANAAVLGDLPVNRRIRDIDHQCLVFVARHLPTAGHLRYVTAARRLTVELERIGDYAASIGRATAHLSQPLPEAILRDIELMADHAERVLDQAMEAFAALNADQAVATRALSRQMDSTYNRAISDLIREGERGDRPFADLLATSVAMNRLERVNDQAKNICEETVFAVTGEAKPPKVYDVLFVDEHNAGLSKLAEAIARRDYPGSGRYNSAGWDPADAIDPSVAAYMNAHSLTVLDHQPSALQPVYDALTDYEVIVSMQGDARPMIPMLPFHTVLLQWDVGPPIEGLPPGEAESAIDDAARRIEELQSQLAHTLRGREAT